MQLFLAVITVNRMKIYSKILVEKMNGWIFYQSKTKRCSFRWKITFFFFKLKKKVVTLIFFSVRHLIDRIDDGYNTGVVHVYCYHRFSVHNKWDPCEDITLCRICFGLGTGKCGQTIWRPRRRKKKLHSYYIIITFTLCVPL